MKSMDVFELNLASQPFRRERAQMTGGLIGAAALVVSLLVLIVLIVHSRAAAEDLNRQIAADTQRRQTLELQQSQYGRILSKEENTEVFSSSVFLNELIARRGLSWSRIFKDLETVLPPDVRLMAVRLPQLPEQDAHGVNRVQLDMVVATAQPQSFLALLKRLVEASNFGAATVVTQAPPGQNDNLFKYRLTVAYAQKL